MPFKKIFEDTSPFLGPLILLFWTSGDACPVFQSQHRFPHLCTLSTLCNRFLRFTSGVTPTDLLVANMAAKPLHPCTCIK